jgi:hypothetical protein
MDYPGFVPFPTRSGFGGESYINDASVILKLMTMSLLLVLLITLWVANYPSGPFTPSLSPPSPLSQNVESRKLFA